jgi:hypothetical protein
MSVRCKAAVNDPHKPVTSPREVFIVRHDDQRAAISLGKIEQEIDNHLSIFGIEVSGGFVGKENSRIVDERTGYRHPLLLASTEFRGQVVHAARQADALEEFASPGGRRLPPDESWQQNILQSGQFRKEKVGLKNKSHSFVAKPCKGIAREVVKRLALELDSATLRRLQPASV